MNLANLDNIKFITKSSYNDVESKKLLVDFAIKKNIDELSMAASQHRIFCLTANKR